MDAKPSGTPQRARSAWPAPPCSGRLHVWLCEGVTQPGCDALADRLAPGERERAAAFRFDVDRRRFVGSRALLRTVLAHYLSCAPHELEFAPGEWGKPRLSAPDGCETAVTFSLSRSHDLAVLAVARGPEIGVDVEFHRAERADSAIVERHFSAPEQHYIAQAPDRVAAFYEIWTRKEAYLKALGRGLSHPLREFSVAPPHGQNNTPVRDWSTTRPPQSWIVRTLHLPVAPYHAAVATLDYPPVELISLDLAELAGKQP